MSNILCHSTCPPEQQGTHLPDVNIHSKNISCTDGVKMNMNKSMQGDLIINEAK